jgi:adenine-specific DNA methylase
MDKTKDALRLIEVAFPLKQASLASVHEKNVRHGHISTLHIWPARRPLAACRAALLATLFPDPGDPEKRQALLDEIGGEVVTKKVKTTDENGVVVSEEKETLAGGVLAWGQENDPAMDKFRTLIRQLYGGHAPKVLDPFAGGGAIPLEAMRLGCDVTASDLNPVAWFILKCTLDYPQEFAGKKWPLPNFVKEWPDFIEDYLAGKIKKHKGKGKHHFSQPSQPLLASRAALHVAEGKPADVFLPEADLAWHVRTWGRWVLERAKADLASRYPVVDGEPTVAYLWARTARDKLEPFGRIPLLKTFWLCKKKGSRAAILPVPKPDRSGVEFRLLDEAFFTRPGNLDEVYPHLKGWEVTADNFQEFLNKGTMSRAGVWSPCTGRPKMVALTMDDLRRQGQRGLMGTQMTAVVVEATAPNGKKTFKRYRLPTEQEFKATEVEIEDLESVFAEIPFGMPDEPLPPAGTLGFRIPLYGFKKWRDMFTPRQLLALGVFVKHSRKAIDEMKRDFTADEEKISEALAAALVILFGRFVCYMSSFCLWEQQAGEVKNLFARYAFPIVWDFCEANPLSSSNRYYVGAIEFASKALESCLQATANAHNKPIVLCESSMTNKHSLQDMIVTDPPYYNAIPYSDLMDFFYVWQRRIIFDRTEEFNANYQSAAAPKWDNIKNDGELIEDESRHNGDKQKARKAYEEGMTTSFKRCYEALEDNGRFIVVFANKDVSAWEALVSAMITAGFTVTASWPIQTEMPSGLRIFKRASLASSVWIVCRKRSNATPVGWSEAVLNCMREKLFAPRGTLGGRNILQYYFDLGIRGPDFLWAALGPALTAYSAHPFVKKAEGGYMTVPEFLMEVRKLVLQFSLGELPGFRSIQQETQGRGEGLAIDPVTQYYLLHRAYFGLEPAPAGACILYANACGKSETELKLVWNLIEQGGQTKRGRPRTEETEETEEAGTSKGNEYRLLKWQERVQQEDLGESRARLPAPLIDRLQRLMHLFQKNLVGEVQQNFDRWGLKDERAFLPLLQAIRELAVRDRQDAERQLVEALASYLKLSKRQVIVGDKVMDASLFEDNNTLREEKG